MAQSNHGLATAISGDFVISISWVYVGRVAGVTVASKAGVTVASKADAVATVFVARVAGITIASLSLVFVARVAGVNGATTAAIATNSTAIATELATVATNLACESESPDSKKELNNQMTVDYGYWLAKIEHISIAWMHAFMNNSRKAILDEEMREEKRNRAGDS